MTYPLTLGCGRQTWKKPSPERNGRMCSTSHKSSISCYSQRKNFKILSRWYRDPATLQKIFPSTSSSCWRCNAATGTYLHVWWECERIRLFWKQVFQLYDKVYEESLQLTPRDSPSLHVARINSLPEIMSFTFFSVGGLTTHPSLL